jgi:hypothetical protein
MNTAEKIRNAIGGFVYERSLLRVGAVTYFMGIHNAQKIVGCVGSGEIAGQEHGDIGGVPIMVGPLDHPNASAIRRTIPWTAPRCLGLATSVGLGDRLGLATAGHIRAVRGTGLAAVLAQQSIREMTRTRRSADEVMDAATWGVLQEGFSDGFGSDADHLQDPIDVDATVAAGFTQFTIDPGKFVENQADEFHVDMLADYYRTLDFDTLRTSAGDLQLSYVGQTIQLATGAKLIFDEIAFLRAAVKYGNAIAHTVRMFEHLSSTTRRPFELEVSVDETDSPTSPAEHYFFASELRRLGVKWVALAPRFVGRFEKGVDYIGDTNAFIASFALHVAVMRTVGPYKISIHSGSDKFSIYPLIADMTDGLVHLKTAGTSYLEALRAIASIEPALFREILDFARERYDTDKATYHVSADAKKVPAAATLRDEDLPALLDQFDARQALHVTFGSVLTADAGQRFRKRLYAALQRDEETHYAAIQRHLGRHIAPFVKK